MTFTPDIWASVFNLAVFLCLILFPWTTAGAKKFTGLLGFGGLVCLLAFDFYVGYESKDLSLSADLMTLTVVKGIIFFFGSLLFERVFRMFMLQREQNKRPEDAVDPVAKEKFDREMKGMKERNEKMLGS